VGVIDPKKKKKRTGGKFAESCSGQRAREPKSDVCWDTSVTKQEEKIRGREKISSMEFLLRGHKE